MSHLWTYTDRLGGPDDREWLIAELRQVLEHDGLHIADIDLVGQRLREQLDSERA